MKKEHQLHNIQLKASYGSLHYYGSRFGEASLQSNEKLIQEIFFCPNTSQ